MEGVVVLKHCMQEQVSFTVTVAKERFKQKKKITLNYVTELETFLESHKHPNWSRK